jgi:hypothetical protein
MVERLLLLLLLLRARLPCDRDGRLDQEPGLATWVQILCNPIDMLGNVIQRCACSSRPLRASGCGRAPADAEGVVRETMCLGADVPMRRWRLVAHTHALQADGKRAICHTRRATSGHRKREALLLAAAQRQSTAPLASFVGKRSSDTASSPACLIHAQEPSSPRLYLLIRRNGA